MPHRGNEARRASGLLRGVLDRVIDLEQQVSSADAIPNLVRQVSERGECTDSVSLTVTDVDHLTWDESTEGWDQGNQWK